MASDRHLDCIQSPRLGSVGGVCLAIPGTHLIFIPLSTRNELCSPEQSLRDLVIRHGMFILRPEYLLFEMKLIIHELGFIVNVYQFKKARVGKCGWYEVTCEHCGNPKVDGCHNEFQEIIGKFNVAKRNGGIYLAAGSLDRYPVIETYNSVDAYIHDIRNRTNLQRCLAKLTPNPFNPYILGLPNILRALAVQGLEVYANEAVTRKLEADTLSCRSEICALDLFIDQFPWMPINLVVMSHIMEVFEGYASGVIYANTKVSIATCDGVEPKLSYAFFINPYDPTSWYFCLITTLFLTVYMFALQMYFISGSAIWNTMYTTFVTSAGALIEICPDLPNSVKQNPSLLRVIKLVLGLWLLLTLVITNAYRGLVVAELNSPIPSKPTLEHLYQLDGFKIYAGRTVYKSILHHLNRPELHLDVSQGLSRYGLSSCLDHAAQVKGAGELGRNLTLYIDCGTISKLKKLGVSLDDIETWVIWHYMRFLLKDSNGNHNIVRLAYTAINDRHYNLVYEIGSNCTKSVILDDSQQLQSFIEFSRLKSRGAVRHFELKGIEHIGEIGQVFFLFEDSSAQFSYDRMKLIIASGIYNIWAKWYNIKHPTGWAEKLDQLKKDDRSLLSINPDTPIPLSMNSNIQTCFYICGIGLGVSGLLFVVEVIPKVLKMLMFERA